MKLRSVLLTSLIPIIIGVSGANADIRTGAISKEEMLTKRLCITKTGWFGIELLSCKYSEDEVIASIRRESMLASKFKEVEEVIPPTEGPFYSFDEVANGSLSGDSSIGHHGCYRVRAYTRVRNGHTENVSAHQRCR